jgi:tetratricopeptide (TPR) repeat protein
MDRLATLLEMEGSAPSDPFVKYALALEYQKLEDIPNSKAYFELLIKDYPDYLATYYQYGMLLENEAAHDQAMVVYEKGIAIAKAAHDFKTLWELEEALETISDD